MAQKGTIFYNNIERPSSPTLSDGSSKRMRVKTDQEIFEDENIQKARRVESPTSQGSSLGNQQMMNSIQYLTVNQGQQMMRDFENLGLEDEDNENKLNKGLYPPSVQKFISNKNKVNIDDALDKIKTPSAKSFKKQLEKMRMIGVSQEKEIESHILFRKSLSASTSPFQMSSPIGSSSPDGSLSPNMSETVYNYTAKEETTETTEILDPQQNRGRAGRPGLEQNQGLNEQAKLFLQNHPMFLQQQRGLSPTMNDTEHGQLGQPNTLSQMNYMQIQMNYYSRLQMARMHQNQQQQSRDTTNPAYRSLSPQATPQINSQGSNLFSGMNPTQSGNNMMFGNNNSNNTTRPNEIQNTIDTQIQSSNKNGINNNNLTTFDPSKAADTQLQAIKALMLNKKSLTPPSTGGQNSPSPLYQPNPLFKAGNIQNQQTTQTNFIFPNQSSVSTNQINPRVMMRSSSLEGLNSQTPYQNYQTVNNNSNMQDCYQNQRKYVEPTLSYGSNMATNNSILSGSDYLSGYHGAHTHQDSSSMMRNEISSTNTDQSSGGEFMMVLDGNLKEPSKQLANEEEHNENIILDPDHFLAQNYRKESNDFALDIIESDPGFTNRKNNYGGDPTFDLF